MEQSSEPFRRAKYAYDEVLDATKHQDDKIGRVVAALAFLTSAAMALFFTARTTQVRFSFSSTDLPEVAQGSYPLVAWAAFGFFGCVLGSVVLLLLSLAVPLRLPNSSKGSMHGSRLFFTYIAEEDRDSWVRRWTGVRDSDIAAELTSNFARETHNLAERAKTKYRHTSEAVSMFVLALLFLTLAVVLAIGAPPGTGEGTTVEWTTKFRLGLTLLIGLQSGLQLYAAYVDASVSVRTRRRALEGSLVSARKRAEARSLLSLTVLAPIFVSCCLLPGPDPWQRRCGAIALCGAVVFCLLFSVGRWNPEHLYVEADQDRQERWNADRRQAATWVTVAGASSVGASAALAVGGVAQLGAALIPSVLLCVQAISSPVRKHRRLMKEIDRAVAPEAFGQSRRSHARREVKVGFEVARKLLGRKQR